MNTVRKRTNKSKRTARLRTKMEFAPKAHGMVNRFTVMPPSLKRRSRAIPAESAEALARVVAAADLAERGLITVTSTKGMSSEEFFALIKASSPTK